MSALYTVSLLAIALLAGVYFLVRRLSAGVPVREADPEWWEHFSAERYAPLSYLLSSEEFAYLRSLPGYQPAVERQMRSSRARICRLFLQEMKDDFMRLQAVGQALTVAGKCTPEFREQLLRQRVQFSRAWWSVRVQLACWQIGIGSVDVSSLLDAMRASAAKVEFAFVPAS